MKYIKCSEQLPPEDVLVHTCIIEGGDIRMDSKLTRVRSMYYIEDKSMYVYYAPTHWAYIEG